MDIIVFLQIPVCMQSLEYAQQDSVPLLEVVQMSGKPVRSTCMPILQLHSDICCHRADKQPPLPQE